MRILTLLLSLTLSIGGGYLGYMMLNRKIDIMLYVLISIASIILLSFLFGHFLYQSFLASRRTKAANKKVQQLEAQISELNKQKSDLETALATSQPTDPAPTNGQ